MRLSCKFTINHDVFVLQNHISFSIISQEHKKTNQNIDSGQKNLKYGPHSRKFLDQNILVVLVQWFLKPDLINRYDGIMQIIHQTWKKIVME